MGGMMNKTKEPWTLKRILVSIGKVITTIIALWSGFITIAEECGIQLDGINLWIADNSWWVLPTTAFLTGMIFGGWINEIIMRKQKTTAEHIAELESSKDRLEAENKELSDRLNPILQQERKAAETEALIRKKIARLNTDEKKALYWAYEEPGMVPEPASTIWYNFRHLTGMGLMIRERIDTTNRDLCEWFVTDEVEELLQKDDDLRRSLKE